MLNKHIWNFLISSFLLIAYISLCLKCPEWTKGGCDLLIYADSRKASIWWGLSCCNRCLVTKSCLTLLQLHGLKPARLLCPWASPGKNTGVGCHFLSQEIFLTEGSNPCVWHWQVDSLPLSHQGSPKDCLRSIQLMYFISLAQNMQSLCFYLHFQYEEAWPETA